jgi:hypothetical protein
MSILPSGKVLIVGGDRPGASGTAEIFDPTSSTFVATSAPLFRIDHTATSLPSGDVLLVGGYNQSDYASEIERFDSQLKRFVVDAKLHYPRWQHTTTALASGEVLIAGGDNASGVVSTSEIYSSTRHAVLDGPPTLARRIAHTATLLSDGTVMLAGGINPGGPPVTRIENEAQADIEIYDPTKTAFVAPPTRFSARSWMQVTTLTTGDVMISGGRTDPFNAVPTPTGLVEIYDPALQKLRNAPQLSIPRVGHTVTTLDDGAQFVVGGYSSSAVTPSVERYAPSGLTSSAQPALLAPRSSHTATRLPSGK